MTCPSLFQISRLYCPVLYVQLAMCFSAISVIKSLFRVLQVLHFSRIWIYCPAELEIPAWDCLNFTTREWYLLSNMIRHRVICDFRVALGSRQFWWDLRVTYRVRALPRLHSTIVLQWVGPKRMRSIGIPVRAKPQHAWRSLHFRSELSHASSYLLVMVTTILLFPTL